MGKLAEDPDLGLGEVDLLVLTEDSDKVDAAGLGCVEVDDARTAAFAFTPPWIGATDLAQERTAGDRIAPARDLQQLVLEGSECLVVMVLLPMLAEHSGFYKRQMHYTTP
jgi:hypothetical protein